MHRDLQRYLGRTVVLVYLDRRGTFTQRTVHFLTIRGAVVRAYDIDKQAPRTFRVDSIMAVQPVIRRAG